jgi:atypical dual specificity phosphatase
MNFLNFNWVIDGKLAEHQAPASESDLIWLKNQGVLALVRMEESHKLKISSQQIKQVGLLDYHEPVTDFTAPTLHQIISMVNFINKSISENKPVGVSCHSGLGRTGTTLA